jgi:hypothetical protein
MMRAEEVDCDILSAERAPGDEKLSLASNVWELGDEAVECRHVGRMREDTLGGTEESSKERYTAVQLGN